MVMSRFMTSYLNDVIPTYRTAFPLKQLEIDFCFAIDGNIVRLSSSSFVFVYVVSLLIFLLNVVFSTGELLLGNHLRVTDALRYSADWKNFIAVSCWSRNRIVVPRSISKFWDYY